MIVLLRIRVRTIVEIHGAPIKFTFVFVHDQRYNGSLGPISAVYILNQITIGSNRHTHEHFVQIGSLVDPTAVFSKSVQLVISDQIGFQIFFPIPYRKSLSLLEFQSILAARWPSSFVLIQRTKNATKMRPKCNQNATKM